MLTKKSELEPQERREFEEAEQSDALEQLTWAESSLQICLNGNR